MKVLFCRCADLEVGSDPPIVFPVATRKPRTGRMPSAKKVSVCLIVLSTCSTIVLCKMMPEPGSSPSLSS